MQWAYPLYVSLKDSFRAIEVADSEQAPARDAVSYETVTFANDLDAESPYIGEPRPELHNAWHNLLKCTSDDLSHARVEDR